MSTLKPTTSELEVLGILWSQGPLSVREVHRQLSEEREVFYTTTLKTMQVMHSKGLLDRDTSERAHIYSPLVEKDDIERNMIDGLSQTMFSGSTAKLVISALGHNKPTLEELEQIREMIDKMDPDDAV